jgi:hypothetical protein
MSSLHFEDLFERYSSDLDDLRTDSEGRDVLARRLQERRKEFASLMPLLEDAPELAAVALHGAFNIRDRKLLDRAANSAPGLAAFPGWKQLAPALDIAPWARPLIATCLQQPEGDAFLVSAAVLDWMQSEDLRRPQAASQPHDADEDEDEDREDLGEAGRDWLSEQGFDDFER